MIKKTITKFILGAMLAIGSQAFGQSSLVNFSPSSPDTLVMNEQKGIKVLCIPGSLGPTPVGYLIFKNSNNKPVSFTWTVKDKNSEILYSSQPMQVEGESTIEFSNPGTNMVSASAIVNFMFFPKDGAKVYEHKIDINIENQ